MISGFCVNWRFEWMEARLLSKRFKSPEGCAPQHTDTETAYAYTYAPFNRQYPD